MGVCGASCPGVLILLPFPVRVWGMGVMATLGQDGVVSGGYQGGVGTPPNTLPVIPPLGDTKRGSSQHPPRC